jgi:Holliday junction resolvasome RuvABC DNA-binding subunit
VGAENVGAENVGAENVTARAGTENAVVRAHVGAASSETPRNDNDSSAASATKLQLATLRTQAKQALVGLGWKPAIAIPAVDAALVGQRAELTLEQVVHEALRRCPRARGR